MKSPVVALIILPLCIICFHVYGQHEFFHELIIEKKLTENEKWEVVGEANFKNLYGDPGWRRWGASFSGVRKINRLALLGGANGYYTFNKSIVNFFEVRPWMAAQHKIPIGSNIDLRQRLKYEWRFFYSDPDNSNRENYRRLRYQISLDIPLPGKEDSSWELRPFFEWFFIRDPATVERFPNERDYGLVLTKSLKNENELFFSYRFEEFYRVETERSCGHIFVVGYSF